MNQTNPKPNPRAEARAVNEWNAKHPVGTRVKVRPSLKDTKEFPGITSSEAWLTPACIAVVRVHGISGYYSLKHVTPDPAPVPDAA